MIIPTPTATPTLTVSGINPVWAAMNCSGVISAFTCKLESVVVLIKINQGEMMKYKLENQQLCGHWRPVECFGCLHGRNQSYPWNSGGLSYTLIVWDIYLPSKVQILILIIYEIFQTHFYFFYFFSVSVINCLLIVFFISNYFFWLNSIN